MSQYAYITVKDQPAGVRIQVGDIVKFGRVPYLIKEQKVHKIIESSSASYLTTSKLEWEEHKEIKESDSKLY